MRTSRHSRQERWNAGGQYSRQTPSQPGVWGIQDLDALHNESLMMGHMNFLKNDLNSAYILSLAYTEGAEELLISKDLREPNNSIAVDKR